MLVGRLKAMQLCAPASSSAVFCEFCQGSNSVGPGQAGSAPAAEMISNSGNRSLTRRSHFLITHCNPIAVTRPLRSSSWSSVVPVGPPDPVDPRWLLKPEAEDDHSLRSYALPDRSLGSVSVRRIPFGPDHPPELFGSFVPEWYVFVYEQSTIGMQLVKNRQSLVAQRLFRRRRYLSRCSHKGDGVRQV